MKTAEPKIIYLQIGDDADIAEFKPEDFETNAISWCWEKIFKNDIEYISKQSIIGLIDEMIKKLNNEEMTDPTKDYYYQVKEAKSKISALTELKQKIEAL